MYTKKWKTIHTYGNYKQWTIIEFITNTFVELPLVKNDCLWTKFQLKITNYTFAWFIITGTSTENRFNSILQYFEKRNNYSGRFRPPIRYVYLVKKQNLTLHFTTLAPYFQPHRSQEKYFQLWKLPLKSTSWEWGLFWLLWFMSK